MSTKMKVIMMFIIVIVSVMGVSVYASESSNHRIARDNFSFTLSEDMGKNVNIVSYAGDPAENATPGFTEAPYTQFLFYSDDTSYGFLFDQDGGIRLYDTTSLAEYAFMQDVVSKLEMLTEEQFDLQSYTETSEGNSNTLPFLPVMVHGQTIKARPQYVATEDVKGVAFITTSQAVAEPFLSNQFFYTFQGLSTNGEYYVSIVIPLQTNLFPAEMPSDFEMATFVDTLSEYLAESQELLNNAADTDFSPPLTDIEELVKSIHFADTQ